MTRGILVLAASIVATGAVAQSTTVIERDGPAGSRTVVKERSVVEDDDADVVVRRRVETTGGVGCRQKTVARTDAFGDTTVKRKIKC
jgi:hypothetical protein